MVNKVNFKVGDIVTINGKFKTSNGYKINKLVKAKVTYIQGYSGYGAFKLNTTIRVLEGNVNGWYRPGSEVTVFHDCLELLENSYSLW